MGQFAKSASVCSYYSIHYVLHVFLVQSKSTWLYCKSMAVLLISKHLFHISHIITPIIIAIMNHALRFQTHDAYNSTTENVQRFANQ